MPDDYDLFISYARADNQLGWIEWFVDALRDEHRRFTGGRELTVFFDREDIRSFSHWETEIFHKGLTRAQLFLAFLSPNYFASEVCRREWRAWIDQEIARHVLSDGAAPVYIVEVPALFGKPMPGEHEVARGVAQLCRLPAPHDRLASELSPIVREVRRRQLNAVAPFYQAGIDALQRADLRAVLLRLAEDVDARVQHARRAAESISTVPPYNRKFTGRLDELVELRRRLVDNQAGVVAGVHGLGGIGKTELAFTYAHAYAGVYPGGRFYVPCEYRSNLSDAVMHLDSSCPAIREHVSDEERKRPDTLFAAVRRALAERVERLGHVLLVLDNVNDLGLLSAQQTDPLTALGGKLHLLATTRLAAKPGANWLTLGELSAADALGLMEKHKPFADAAERAAAEGIVRRLGGFALAVELVAAGLAARESATYAAYAADLSLADLDELADDSDVELRRHNHEKRLRAVLGPTLEALSPAERRAVEYASLLPPDQVPLPWLKELVTADFPEVAKAGKRGDPWTELCLRLLRLTVFTGEFTDRELPRVVRVHRLVQELVRSEMSEELRGRLLKRIDEMVVGRIFDLKETARWLDVKWELEPLDALAQHWAEQTQPDTDWLMNQIGICWSRTAEWGHAERMYRQALDIRERSYGPDHRLVAESLSNLAGLLQTTNRPTEAEPLIRRAVAIHERNHGPNHPNGAIALNNLAGLLRHTNRPAEAEPLFRRALAIQETRHGPDHPEVATALSNLADLLAVTGRPAEAEPLFRRALDIGERSYGPDHPDVALWLNNLAWLLSATNRYVEAEPLFRRVLSTMQASLGPDHPKVGTALGNLAELLRATDRPAEAEPLLRRALAIDEQSYGQDHPDVAVKLSILAELLRATNRPAEAESLYERSVRILIASRATTGHKHPDFDVLVTNYGCLLMNSLGLGEEEAVARIRRVLGLDS